MTDSPRRTAALRVEALVGVMCCFTGEVSAVVLAVNGRWVDAAVLMLVGLGQAMAFLSFRRGWARGAVAMILWGAGMSSAFHLYDAIWWWDLATHVLTTGALVWIWHNAALRGVSRPRVVAATGRAIRRWPRGGGVALCLLLGLGLAVAWEILELAGHVWVSSDVYVAPGDTVSDVIAGLFGAALVGSVRIPR